MKKVILTVFISLFFITAITAQHNISYGVWIPISCEEGGSSVSIAGGSGFEGEEFTIPSYIIPDEYKLLGEYFQHLQLIANAFAGAKIGLPEESLNEDVALEIDLTSAKCSTPFNNLIEALSLTITVVGETSGPHEPFSYYNFNEGKEAYIILKVENLLPLLDELDMKVDDIIGWFADQGLTPDVTGIRIGGTKTELILYLSHFSKIVIGTNASATDVKTMAQLPSEYNLAQNYPNPFNPTTNISYSLPQNGYTKLTVYNSIGVEVKTLVSEVKTAGTYELTFDASDFTSGIYFYDLTSNNFRSTKKMILIK